jgi:hypothetical protein
MATATSFMRLRGREVSWSRDLGQWKLTLEDGTFVFCETLVVLDQFLEHLDLKQGAERAQATEEA